MSDDARSAPLRPAPPQARGRLTATRSAPPPPPPTPCSRTTSSSPTPVLTGSGSGSRSTHAVATFPSTRPTWSSWPPPAPRCPTASTASATCRPSGATRHPRTRTATSTCGRRSAASSTASQPDQQPQGRPHHRRYGRPSTSGWSPKGQLLAQQLLEPREVVGHELRVLPRQVAQFPRPPTRPARVGQRAVGQASLHRPLAPVLRRA